MKEAEIPRVAPTGTLDRALDADVWRDAAVLCIDSFRPESAVGHRPMTRCALVHDGEALLGRFSVQDRYVRCVHDAAEGGVCRDSCVEFFFSPRLAEGYVNLEFNCGGHLFAQHVRDPRRVDGGFRDARRLSAAELSAITVRSSMPTRVEPEIGTPVDWWLAFRLPLAFVTTHFGAEALEGDAWRANAYKCGDQTSHPHWASWNPVPRLNFHEPEAFGRLWLVGLPASCAQ